MYNGKYSERKEFEMRYKSAKIFAGAVLCSLALTFGAFGGEISAVRSYNGQFSDISSSDWYYESVSGAYSLGIISGVDDTHFSPNGTVTVAQAIKIAASCHQLLADGYTTELDGGDNWYDGYLSYAKANGIVTEEYDSYTVPATRAQTAVLLSRAIVSSGESFEVINSASLGSLADVSGEEWYAGAVYRLYKWGIMTGQDGYINPESSIKRSEISAIVLRIAYPEKRVDTSGSNSSGTSATSSSASTNQRDDSVSSIRLYGGDVTERKFTGITSFAAQFKSSGGEWASDKSYSLELVNELIIEKDNISFRLYKNSGYEALGIVRGWLGGCATGENGVQIREASECYAELNDMFYLFIDGERETFSELWYADHGDYTTYALYFDEDVKLGGAEVIELMCGKYDDETLSLCGLGELSSLIENAEKSLVYGEKEKTEDTSDAISDTDSFVSALADAKNGADILFEQRNSRCTVLYGSGLYGSGSDSYRLVLIYNNGTVQTLCNQRIASIRMADGVMYYSLTAPDGKAIQYGINFGE